MSVRLGNRLGEAIRFAKYLPSVYRRHVLELQRRFNGVEDDPCVLFFARGQYLRVPNDVTAFRVWQQFFADSASALEVRQFLSLSRGSSRFLDIGAAHGLFSAIFCRSRTEQARIVALEPTDGYLTVLHETLQLNAGSATTYSVERTALMDRNDDAELQDASFDGFFTKLSDLVDPHQGVHIETLDGLCSRLDFEPDLVKMDVDGFESEILLGSPTFLQRHRPKVHLELHFRDLQHRGKDPEAILSLISRSHDITAALPKAFRQASVARLSLEPR